MVVLAVMYVEVITVLIRQQNHFRITRALRPIFFIDNYLMNGVRRYGSMHVHVHVWYVCAVCRCMGLMYHTLLPPPPKENAL